MAYFERAFFLTNQNEGGYANVDGDSGEETYAGISRKWFPNWDGWNIIDAHKPLHNNQLIHDEKLNKFIEQFYKHEFWDKCNLDNCPNQELANSVYDMAVNSGIQQALKLLSV